MNILEETTALISSLNISVETGVFSDVAPDEYAVITPMVDTYELFADNKPGFETQEARLTLYSKGNYLAMKQSVLSALLAADFTIESRQYIGHEDDTGYHHYNIDYIKVYPVEED